MTIIGACPRCKKQSLKQFSEREIIGVSKCRTKVVSNIHEGASCVFCGYHRCSRNEKVDSKGHRVG
jgi:hypothetical protein